VFDACYNDPPGGSAFARFRLNHLTHLNRRFDGDFVLHNFVPRAHYDCTSKTVEGHLYSTQRQTINVAKLGIELVLDRDDSINVGFSAKFHRAQLVSDIAALGFEPAGEWIDAGWRYGLFLFVRV
jgi:L-histidine N-alpha-methyltransferase